MKWYDLFSLSLSNMWRRKLRTALTVLGVLIGTASIISMLSIGIGQQEALMKSIASSNELTMISVEAPFDGMNMSMKGGMVMTGDSSGRGNSNKVKLNKEAIEQLSRLEHVQYCSPILDATILVQQGRYQSHLQVQAMTKEALEALNLHFERGQMPDFSQPSDLPQIISGNEVQNNFWDPNSRSMQYEPPDVDLYDRMSFAVYDVDAYHASMGEGGPKPKKYLFKIAGVIGKRENEEWSQHSWQSYTEINHLEEFYSRIFRGKAWPGQPRTKTGKPTGEIVYNRAIVRTTDLDHTKEVMDSIRQLGFQVHSNIEFIDTMKQQAATTQMVLGGIGAVSLLVAAIGIANTMMMSIYERTREIGVFKVLGCSLSNIRNLFLAEAGFIGLIGGILGLGFSYLISYLINSASLEGMGILGMGMGFGGQSFPLSVIPIWLAPAAMAFATFIGMFSGLMPARRAMKLSALEAIRTQ